MDVSVQPASNDRDPMTRSPGRWSDLKYRRNVQDINRQRAAALLDLDIFKALSNPAMLEQYHGILPKVSKCKPIQFELDAAEFKYQPSSPKPKTVRFVTPSPSRSRSPCLFHLTGELGDPCYCDTCWENRSKIAPDNSDCYCDQCEYLRSIRHPTALPYRYACDERRREDFVNNHL